MKQEETVSEVHEALETQEPLIELRNIYKIYYMGDEEVHANDGISLSINKGEFVAIVGKSGSGKSTLMNIIGALDVPTEGEYFLGGEDVADLAVVSVKRVVNVETGAAGIAENRVDALLQQAFTHDLRGFHFHSNFTLPE